jgi:ATP-dependent helicase/nuclease subunit A
MTGQADADSRRRILTDYDSTLFVEAAAGTGKTTALVGRIVRLVRAGAAQLNRVVAVTFTEKAAGEMKLHLRSQIERARSEATPVERGRFDLALSELELARIGTIHAFCGDLLRERPVEAGIDPLFEVASEPATEALAAQAFDAWFERALSRPPEGIRRLLRRRSRGSSPREELRLAMNRLREHRDFPQGWRRDPFDRNGAIDALIPRLTAVGRLAIESSWPEDYLSQNLAEIAKFIDETTRLEAVQGRDYDGLEAELRRFARHWSWRWSGARRTRFGALTRDEVLVRRDTIKAELDDFAVKSGADLAPLLHEDLQEPIAQYELLKTKAGQLDYLDLLIKTRDLIRDHAAVREELQQRFTHFFVDEFQDTDPLQAEILLLLAIRSERDRLAPWAAHSWKALYRRRPQTIDLSFPPCGNRRLRGGQAAAARAWRKSPPFNQELPRAALDPIFCQRRVRRRHGSRPRCRPSTLCPAWTRAARSPWPADAHRSSSPSSI